MEMVIKLDATRSGQVIIGPGVEMLIYRGDLICMGEIRFWRRKSEENTEKHFPSSLSVLRSSA